MDEFQTSPTMRPKRRTGRRLLVAGLACLLVVAVTAIARADTPQGPTKGTSTSSTGTNSTSRTVRGRTFPAGTLGTYHGKRIFLPADVAPPATNRVLGVLFGSGALVYTCTGRVFTLTEPAISVFTLHGKSVGIHFAPLAWESTRDGSRVDAAAVREVPTRNTVTRVLLRAVNVHGGQGTFGLTSFIVRLPLTGGVPPAACAVPGKRIGVPFQTIYVFFRATTSAKTGAKTGANTGMTYGMHW